MASKHRISLFVITVRSECPPHLHHSVTGELRNLLGNKAAIYMNLQGGGGGSVSQRRPDIEAELVSEARKDEAAYSKGSGAIM